MLRHKARHTAAIQEDDCKLLEQRKKWLTSLDNFRNWLALGLQPAKAHENQPRVRMAPAGAARSNRASGAVEAEQLFDPERA
jgi:hypothetical protein